MLTVTGLQLHWFPTSEVWFFETHWFSLNTKWTISLLMFHFNTWRTNALYVTVEFLSCFDFYNFRRFFFSLPCYHGHVSLNTRRLWPSRSSHSHFLSLTSLTSCQKTKTKAKPDPEWGARIYGTVKAQNLSEWDLIFSGQIKLGHNNCLYVRDLESKTQGHQRKSSSIGHDGCK